MRDRWSIEHPPRGRLDYTIMSGKHKVGYSPHMQAAYLMAAAPALYEAAKAVLSDPGRTKLSPTTLELIEEALAAAE